jgi:rhodanese-related sulfurtransferase
VRKSDALHGLTVAFEGEGGCPPNAIHFREVLGMNDVRVLSTAKLQQGLDRDSGLHVLNVQTDQFFAGELIPGSRRSPLDRIEEGVKELPKDAAIITYCAGPACSQSSQAAQKLAELGYTNVRAYEDGLEGWKAAGRETVQVQPVPAA